jgi:signal transduction histidine kinase
MARIRDLMLHEFVTANREEIVRRCRAKVAKRSIPPPTQAEIEHGVPLFLDQLVEQLKVDVSSTLDIKNSAVLHGNAMRRHGYTVSQVVNDYGDVCQAVTELALEIDAPIATDDFRMLNQCLDVAIAGAVTEYGRASDQSAMEIETARATERLGFLAHELRNLIHTAIVAFEVLKSGNVGVGGSTGTVLHRSLMGAHDLIGRSLAEVRLANGVQQLDQFPVAGLVDELTPAAILAANARGLTLTVAPIPDHLMIEADRQVLGAVVMNLLQNAFKFTRPCTAVVLRVVASAERVLFEVEDECGGLPEGDANDLFRPFEQRSANRTGLGLGLAFSRWAVEAHHGAIYSRSLPGKGCVFTVDLPQRRAAAFPMD